MVEARNCTNVENPPRKVAANYFREVTWRECSDVNKNGG